MSVNLPPCPGCGSDQLVKNGKIDHGKQNLSALDCSRQLVQDRENKVIEHATKELIDQFLLEKIPWSGMARAKGVSEPWLQSDVNAIYEAVPKQVKARAKKRALSGSV